MGTAPTRIIFAQFDNVKWQEKNEYLTRNTILGVAKSEVWKTPKQLVESVNVMEKCLRATLDLVSHISC